MNSQHAIRVHYFDASALVKLVADDPDETLGRDALRQYYYAQANRYATSFSVAETFSAFKLKYVRRRISQAQYISYVNDFIGQVIGVNLEIDEIPILAPDVRHEAERLIKTYGIDFLDCFQIVTILRGRFRHHIADSQSLLITADRALAAAARGEHAVVWECTSEPAPSW